MCHINKRVFIHIGDTVDLHNRLERVVKIIDAARSKRYDEILISFLESFDQQTFVEKSKNSYLLEKETWLNEISKSNWQWEDIQVYDKKATILIHHSPLSNYTDLIHALMYVGIDIANVKIEDDLFGKYTLIDTNIRV
ncbi:hypothetical protein [Lewinella sp. LCG006]|uniref:hypothetical protein n=1 Tax=Lewinella sp. LCG006 TaxID=3231911 RepID=UPI00346066DA